MAGTSDYLEAAVLDAVLKNTTYTSPATVYVALYNADPTDADSATEISGNGYVRQSCAFSRTAGVGIKYFGGRVSNSHWLLGYDHTRWGARCGSGRQSFVSRSTNIEQSHYHG